MSLFDPLRSFVRNKYREDQFYISFFKENIWAFKPGQMDLPRTRNEPDSDFKQYYSKIIEFVYSSARQL